MSFAKPFCLFSVAALLAAPVVPHAWAIEDKPHHAEKEDDDEGEVTVKLEDLPAPVRETLQKAAKGGKIEEIEKEEKHGKTVYEADVVIDGKEYEVKIAADGKLISKKLDDDEDDDKDDDHKAHDHKGGEKKR